MQLIQQTTLLYQEGRSDKIYEVDLCLVRENAYVVNFRYGRRGGTLREGAETVAALSLNEAQIVFNRLVLSKIRKGYRDITGQDPSQSSPPPPPVSRPARSVDPNARIQAILNQLASGRSSQRWPLERAIWRAGELKIQAATPALLQLLGSGIALREYCIAWALGWCGDVSTIPALEQLAQNPSTTDATRRIALAAMFKLADAAKTRKLHENLLTSLPLELRELAQNGSAEAFTQTLRNYLNNGSYQQFTVIDMLYHLNTEPIRPALLEIVRQAPLQPNYFKPLRHLFKLAEYHQDAEMFGILAYRFENAAAMYRSGKGYIRLPDDTYISRCNYTYNDRTGRYRTKVNSEFQREMQRPDARIAYSSKTRDYLRRRVWRSLRRLGELDETAYVQLALGVLLQYSDSDAQPIRESISHRWNYQTWTRHEVSRVQWDAFAGFMTFNHILYEQSPRYELKQGGRAWRCKPPYKPGNPIPTVREEAFPHLWEQQPEALLRLLLASQCLPVHQFAVKALRACPAYCETLDLAILIQLLDRAYEITAEFGFELARSRYQPENPNPELLLAIANCAFAPARTEVHRWIREQPDRFLGDGPFMARLVTSAQPDTRAFARQFLAMAILDEPAARSLIGHIIATLLTLEATQIEVAADAAETLLLSFTPQLRTLGLEIVLDLLRHPLAQVQALGAQILLNHGTPVVELPAGLIDALLVSPHDPVRVIGVRLFGQLPDSVLLTQTQLIVTLATHLLPEMREAIRPAIRRLASGQPEFGQRLADQLVVQLLQPEESEGVHAFLVQLLHTDLSGWLSTATPEVARSLLQADATAAQELAGRVLQENCTGWAEDFVTPEIAQWANHEVKSVREAAQAMIQQVLPRLRHDPEELLATLPFLESSWQDSQAFGFRLLGELLSPEDFTPAVLVGICDSNQPKVRKFGRDLVGRCFQASDGQQYLVKFSEHPATDMQLFATNYLETYVADQPAQLQALQPYFVRVLGQVNRGRVTKQRVFAFLAAEAQKSEAAAIVVAEVLARQSATIAIGDKAKALETLLKIQKTYPHLSMPIQVKPVEVRRGV